MFVSVMKGLVAPDKREYQHKYVSHFSMKTHVVGTH